MTSIRRIEFLGGPLDGKRPALPADLEVVAWTDGAAVYRYDRETQVIGERSRDVMRHTGTVPMARRA